MNLKESIRIILSDRKAKKEGLHIKHIARHILNMHNNLFTTENDINFDTLKKKVTRILANDVKKKRGSEFIRVKNPKTDKFRRGLYKLK